MRIAICDDDIHELALISTIIEEFKQEHCKLLTYEVFNNPQSLLQKVQKQEFDLLLLDVIMPEMTGIELASTIRSFDIHLPIVFLTTSPEFAMASYRVHAKDYILKPVNKKLLFDVLLKQYKSSEQFFFFKTIDSVMQLPLSDLVYLEVESRKLYIYLEDGSRLQASGILSDYEERLLQHPQFYKPHRSFLVNLAHISKIDKDGVHTTIGTTIPIPKPNFSKTKNAYMTYLMQ